MHASEVVHLHDYLCTCTLPSDVQPTQLNVSPDIHTYLGRYLRTETHFQVVSRQAQAQAQVQGTKPKKRQSTADDIRARETHKQRSLEYARQSATRRRESGERERERQKLYTVVRETQRISRILFFLFSYPFSHHSHTNGVNKAFFPSGATTYAAVLALRPGTEPCDHQPPCLPT